MTILISLLALVLFPTTAHAYLDPGTGSMMLQGLIAALAAVVVAIKTFWGSITGFFRKKEKDD